MDDFVPERPEALPAILRRFQHPWWIAGGWAVDLAVGTPSRSHEDIEIAVFYDDQAALRRALDGWDLHIAAHGKLLRWAVGQVLQRPYHQLWARRDARSPWSLEILFESRTDDDWVFRRDERERRPVDLYGQRAGDLPVVSLEVQLLYKAKEPRPKDEHDFAVALPRLSDGGTAWLRSALEIAHPGHRWLDQL